MTRTLLPLWVALLLLGGCCCEDRSEPPVSPPPEKAAAVASADAEKPDAEKPDAKKPDAKKPEPPQKPPEGTSASYHWPADFKLPLEITLEAPEVPKEIMGPSPPIEQKKP